MLARLEGPNDEDESVNDCRDDRRIGDGDDRWAVDDDTVEPLGELLDEVLEAGGMEHVGRIRRRRPCRNGPQILDDSGLCDLVERCLPDEYAGDARLARSAKNAMEAWSPQVAVDDTDALTPLSEGNRNAAGHRRLSLGRSGA